jgi:hypothetical protein
LIFGREAPLGEAALWQPSRVLARLGVARARSGVLHCGVVGVQEPAGGLPTEEVRGPRGIGIILELVTLKREY